MSAEKQKNKKGVLPHRKKRTKKEFFFGGDYKQTKMFPPSTGEVCHKKHREREREREKQKVGPNNSSRQDSYSAANSALCLYSFFRSFPIPLDFFFFLLL
jgi:hypothetical protein